MENYRHSFFVQTVYDWNKINDSAVNAKTADSFKTFILKVTKLHTP